MPRRCTVCDHPDRNHLDRLLIEDKLSLQQIADKNGLTRAAAQWHRDNHLPTELTRAAESANSARRADLLDIAIASKRHRLESQARRHERLETLVDQRLATDPEDLPTGKALQELREIEKQAAAELGEGGGGHSGPMVVVVQVPPSTVEPVTIEVLGRRPTAADQIAPPQVVDALPEPDLDLDELRDETPEKPHKPESYF
jgi:hypothetical protein